MNICHDAGNNEDPTNPKTSTPDTDIMAPHLTILELGAQQAHTLRSFTSSPPDPHAQKCTGTSTQCPHTLTHTNTPRLCVLCAEEHNKRIRSITSSHPDPRAHKCTDKSTQRPRTRTHTHTSVSGFSAQKKSAKDARAGSEVNACTSCDAPFLCPSPEMVDSRVVCRACMCRSPVIEESVINEVQRNE